jgi:hypothetical protein
MRSFWVSTSVAVAGAFLLVATSAQAGRRALARCGQSWSEQVGEKAQHPRRPHHGPLLRERLALLRLLGKIEHRLRDFEKRIQSTLEALRSAGRVALAKGSGSKGQAWSEVVRGGGGGHGASPRPSTLPIAKLPPLGTSNITATVNELRSKIQGLAHRDVAKVRSLLHRALRGLSH